jgi:hypothetical protein
MGTMDIHPEFRIREAADADLCGNLFRQPRNEKADDFRTSDNSS